MAPQSMFSITHLCMEMTPGISLSQETASALSCFWGNDGPRDLSHTAHFDCIVNGVAGAEVQCP